MSDTLPAKRELGVSPAVPVSIPDQVVTEEEALEAFRRQGMAKIPAKLATDLRTIGISFHQVGITKIQRGRAVMTQERLDSTIRIIQEQIDRISEDKTLGPKSKVALLAKLAEAQCACISRMTDSIELMVKLDKGREITQEQMIPEVEQMTQPFGAGEVVKPGATMIATKEVHIHNGPTPQK